MPKTLFHCLTLCAALLAAPTVSHAQIRASVSVTPIYRIRTPPPAMRVDVRPAQPSPNHVWINGYWRWTNNQHVWSPGRWEMGRPGHVWIDSHWVHENGQWAFYDGRWQASSDPYHQEVVVNTAPPQPNYEVTPGAYEPGHEWIHGHWEWHGEHHVWIPGRYELRPEHQHWEHHRWERVDDGRWRFHRGRWRAD
jgi:hypothetical protein